LKIEISGKNVDRRQDKNSANDKGGTRLLEKRGSRIEENGHKQDIDDIRDADIPEGREHEVSKTSEPPCGQSLTHGCFDTAAGARAVFNLCRTRGIEKQVER
jgi:hypothetical protein